MTPQALHTIPIADRPAHGPWFSRIFFPLIFNLGQIGIFTSQVLALPLLLIPFVGSKAFRSVIDYTKDGYGRLLILITVLFGPTSLVLTTDTPPSLTDLVERDDEGNMKRINLPDRLVVIANHQAYLDWMYMWILACYSGNSAGLIILLKASLKNMPVVGWGMQFFRFIFMHRSWAADRDHLTRALTSLGKDAQAQDFGASSASNGSSNGEAASLLAASRLRPGASPLWLLIFPEGTIVSDEERSKSIKYAERESIPDLTTMLHPRSTGLLFCLRTLLAQVPDTQLLDVTIGYPGVPLGHYPQDHYGLFSVFWRSVPPPTVHIHLHLYSDLTAPGCEIPSLVIKPQAEVPVDQVPADTGLASPEESKAFERWLRGLWIEKDERMKRFYRDQRFVGEEKAEEVVAVRQQKWADNIAAFGAGGLGSLAVLLGSIVGVAR